MLDDLVKNNKSNGPFFDFKVRKYVETISTVLFASLLSLVIIKKTSKNLKKLLQAVYTNKKTTCIFIKFTTTICFYFYGKFEFIG